MKGKWDEKVLLYKVRTEKDPDAFGRLYDLYIDKIYRFIYFKLNNKEETEDLTSGVFLKVWSYLIVGPGKEIDSFSGLVYKVARNSLIDLYREKAKRHEFPLEQGLEQIADTKEIKAIENLPEIEMLLKKLKRLKQDYQEVLTMRYVEELTVREIAEILGKSNINIRVTLHRATKKLQELVGDEQID